MVASPSGIPLSACRRCRKPCGSVEIPRKIIGKSVGNHRKILSNHIQEIYLNEHPENPKVNKRFFDIFCLGESQNQPKINEHPVPEPLETILLHPGCSKALPRCQNGPPACQDGGTKPPKWQARGAKRGGRQRA